MQIKYASPEGNDLYIEFSLLIIYDIALIMVFCDVIGLVLSSNTINIFILSF